MWKITAARDLAFDLELEVREHGWHVALGGSVLHVGRSRKDLDIIVYPHTVARHVTCERKTVWEAMKKLGFRRVSSAEATREVWRERGSKDTKTVEVYRDEQCRKVDVFYLS